MVEWSPTAYTKQIELYIKNRDFGKALALAKEYVEKNPDELIPNFMMGKCCFWAGKINYGLKYARKAFNLSREKDDLIMCGILLASIYFRARKYKEGHSLLHKLEAEGNEDVEKLLLIFSIAMNDEGEMKKHLEELYKINSRSVEDIVY
jgi:tetratricopeptide (TPR) repeat protein